MLAGVVAVGTWAVCLPLISPDLLGVGQRRQDFVDRRTLIARTARATVLTKKICLLSRLVAAEFRPKGFFAVLGRIARRDLRYMGHLDVSAVQTDVTSTS